MKKGTILFVLLLLSVCVMAQQVPQRMAYQAVIRNASGQLLVNATVGIRISIHMDLEDGPEVFSETHTVTTNANGLANLKIGDGTAQTAPFNTVDWSSGVFFLQTDIDPQGGTNYSITGVSELLSVPYAFYSANGGTAGPEGPPGPQGPPGPAGSLGVTGFSGSISAIVGNNSLYVFAGPTASITITSTSQKVTLVAHAPIGLQAGSSPQDVRVGACYQPPGGSVENFVGSNFSIVTLTTTKTMVGVSATISGFQPGTYTVGMGIQNPGANPINNNDFVNGWVMVTE